MSEHTLPNVYASPQTNRAHYYAVDEDLNPEDLLEKVYDGSKLHRKQNNAHPKCPEGMDHEAAAQWHEGQARVSQAMMQHKAQQHMQAAQEHRGANQKQGTSRLYGPTPDNQASEQHEEEQTPARDPFRVIGPAIRVEDKPEDDSEDEEDDDELRLTEEAFDWPVREFENWYTQRQKIVGQGQSEIKPTLPNPGDEHNERFHPNRQQMRITDE